MFKPKLTSILSQFERTIDQLNNLVDSHQTRIGHHNAQTVYHQSSANILRSETERATAIIVNIKNLLGDN